jgi:hypothetical protein
LSYYERRWENYAPISFGAYIRQSALRYSPHSLPNSDEYLDSLPFVNQ